VNLEEGILCWGGGLRGLASLSVGAPLGSLVGGLSTRDIRKIISLHRGPVGMHVGGWVSIHRRDS